MLRFKRPGQVEVKLFDLLSERDLDSYNHLLSSGVSIIEESRPRMIPGVPGGIGDDGDTVESIPPKLIIIVKYIKGGK